MASLKINKTKLLHKIICKEECLVWPFLCIVLIKEPTKAIFYTTDI